MLFNAVPLICEILEELGYQNGERWVAIEPSVGFGKYRVTSKSVRFRTRAFPYRCGILKISGEQVHVHGFDGTQTNCAFVNLTDPRSLDILRLLISTFGSMDDN